LVRSMRGKKKGPRKHRGLTLRKKRKRARLTRGPKTAVFRSRAGSTGPRKGFKQSWSAIRKTGDQLTLMNRAKEKGTIIWKKTQ